MFTDYDYFLLIAEEMNISRAAKRAFVSQQSLSKYLKNLEEEHGTALFERKPNLSLTPAGKVVLQRARQMKMIAANMQLELDEIKNNAAGRIVFGTSVGRAMDLTPLVFPEFNERYPHVQVEIKMGVTRDLLPQLTNGMIDVVIGIGAEKPAQAEEILLTEETFYLAISDSLLMKYFPDDYPECKMRFMQGVDLHEFAQIPFMENTSVSNSKTLINNYLVRNEITLNDVLLIEDCGTQLKIAQSGCAACFFPAMLLNRAAELNKANPSKPINIFPLKDNKDYNRVSLFYIKQRHLPPYLRYFVSLLTEKYHNHFMSYKTFNF